jgi:copper chaperone
MRADRHRAEEYEDEHDHEPCKSCLTNHHVTSRTADFSAAMPVCYPPARCVPALVRTMIRMSSGCPGWLADVSCRKVISSRRCRRPGRGLLFTVVGIRSLEVTGMTCDHCARAVRAEISKLAGVTQVEVDVETGAVLVAGDPLPADAALREAIEEAGYSLAG